MALMSKPKREELQIWQLQAFMNALVDTLSGGDTKFLEVIRDKARIEMDKMSLKEHTIILTIYKKGNGEFYELVDQ
jgi:hypothetical protein